MEFYVPCQNESAQRLEYASYWVEWAPHPDTWGDFTLGTITITNQPLAVFVDGAGFSLRPAIGSLGTGLHPFWARTFHRWHEGDQDSVDRWWMNHCEKPDYTTAKLNLEGAFTQAGVAALPVELFHLESMASDYYSFSPAGVFVKNARYESSSEHPRRLVMAAVWAGGEMVTPPHVHVSVDDAPVWDGELDQVTAKTTPILPIPPGRLRVEVPSAEYGAGALYVIFWLLDEVPALICSTEESTFATCDVSQHAADEA